MPSTKTPQLSVQLKMHRELRGLTQPSMGPQSFIAALHARRTESGLPDGDFTSDFLPAWAGTIQPGWLRPTIVSYICGSATHLASVKDTNSCALTSASVLVAAVVRMGALRYRARAGLRVCGCVAP